MEPQIERIEVKSADGTVVEYKVGDRTTEVTCVRCGVSATCYNDMCEHLKAKHAQGELPGMPEKSEATKIAEDILDMRDERKALGEKLDELNQKFINEMRSIQKDYIIVKGWNFEVSLQDKLEVSKHKT